MEEFQAEIKLGLKIPSSLRYFESIFFRLASFIDYIYQPIFKIVKIIGKVFKIIDSTFLPQNNVIRLKEYLVPLQDGGKLATDIYLPRAIFTEKRKEATILIRLPYWKDRLSILGYFLASKGYVTILQDIRGSAHSRDFGTNSLYMYERQDGFETLDWIKNRFWFNDKVGMWGISYLGITQLAISWDNENRITCLNPIHSSYTNLFWHPGGLYPVGISASLFLFLKATSRFKSLNTLDFRKWDPEGYHEDLFFNPQFSLYNEPLKSKKPKLSDMAQLSEPKFLLKTMNRVYNTKINVSRRDDGSFQQLIKEVFYKKLLNHNYNISPYVFGCDFKLKTPILMIGGWYDIFIEQSLNDISFFQKNAPDYLKNHFKMIIGPWSHYNLDKLINKPFKLENLKITFSFFREILPFWWFDYWLKDIDLNLSQIPNFRIFVLNRNRWRNFDKWPPKCEELIYFLHSGGNSNTKYGDGALLPEEPQHESPDKYFFKPRDPVLTRGGRNLLLLPGPQDQSKVEERNDILIYTSEKLEKGIEIIGIVKIIFYASSSAVDTDFMVKLVDVYPNNELVINVIDSGIRTRFRKGDLNKPELITPVKIYRCEGCSLS